MLLTLDIGAKDTGAINSSLGLYERNQVWKIASYLKGYLEAYEDTRVCMTYPVYTETGETLSRSDRSDLMKAYNELRDCYMCPASGPPALAAPLKSEECPPLLSFTMNKGQW